mmetsp:Transcript_46809/g.111365  ORF Transcript_46809/g.111365 Transcript_46809/m.111365 type:complete len:85 (+) Transcript_46809:32-286(+)
MQAPHRKPERIVPHLDGAAAGAAADGVENRGTERAIGRAAATPGTRFRVGELLTSPRSFASKLFLWTPGPAAEGAEAGAATLPP